MEKKNNYLKNNTKDIFSSLQDKRKQLKVVRELLLDSLIQSCGIEDNKIDNMCMNPYEEICTHLKTHGYLDKINDRIYILK